LRPRDIIVFLVDCLRADVLERCAQRSQLPGLQRLFDGACRVQDVFSVASTTTPAVSSLLTGCYPFRHGVRTLYGYRLNPARATLPQRLRGQGYRTEAYLTGPFFQDIGLQDSFDVYEYRSREDYVHGPWGDRLAERLCTQSAQPRFVLVHFWELHFPKQVLPEFQTLDPVRQYEGALRSLDRFFQTRLTGLDPGTATFVLTGDHGELISGSEWIWLRFKHAALRALGVHSKPERIRYWRRFKQLMVDPLKRRGGEPFKIGHGFSVMDQLVRIPLWIAAGGDERRIRVKALNSQVDIAPTIADLSGIAQLEDIDGLSLEAAAQHDAVYLEECVSVRAEPALVMKGVRTPNAKYVCWPFAPGRREEFYDLTTDPGERRNLAADGGSDERLADLRRRLRAFGEETADQYVKGFVADEQDRDLVERRLAELGYFE
jgi:arylsulfatase A-like enzyme